MFDRPELVHATVRSGFAGTRMLVVGDVMLDRYLVGEVARISPEAPVPVVRLRTERATVGGAGNVALNLAGLGVRADCTGWVGGDAAGTRVHELLAEAGVGAQRLETVPGRPTTTKTRVLSGQQQLVRIDDEESVPRAPTERSRWDDAVLELVDDGYDALVLSDYAKGVLADDLCRRLIRRARDRGIPVLVDPKGVDYAKYRGATTITPNERELALTAQVSASEPDALLTAAIRLRRSLDLDFLTLTRGEEGISLVDEAGVRHVPARAREVFDVSGAGDTAIATLAAGIATGLDPHDAAVLANLAAGTIVGRRGTVAIHRDDLRVALGPTAPVPPEPDAKVLTAGAAVVRARQWRAEGDEIGFTNGCFDLLHAGHVRSLDWARRHCDRLVVGLNADASVRALKGDSRPVNGETARAQVIAALAAVDAVVIFEGVTPLSLIEMLRPDVLVKGEDYAGTDIVGAAEVRGWGGRVLRAPLTDGLSTTGILARLGGDAASA